MNAACAVRKITLLLEQLYSSSVVQFALWQLYVTSSLHHIVFPMLSAAGWGYFPYSCVREHSHGGTQKVIGHHLQTVYGQFNPVTYWNVNGILVYDE